MAGDPDYVNPTDSPSSPSSKADKKAKKKLGAHESTDPSSVASDPWEARFNGFIDAIRRWRKVLIGLLILIVAITVGGLIAGVVGNFYVGMGAFVIKLLLLPLWLALSVLVVGLSVISIVVGIQSLLKSGSGMSPVAAILLLVEGAAVGMAFLTFGLPGLAAPIKDIPYLAAPETGTVYVDGVHESVSGSDDDETTTYYLFCVPKDLPGHDGSWELLRFDIGYANYRAWKSDLGEASPEAADFTSPGLAAVRGKPVYRISMLPNTNTLLSFEEVR